MEVLKLVKWYHIVIVSLFFIILFLLFTGSYCVRSKEGFVNPETHQMPDGKINKYNGEIVLYYADWCPHCKNFSPIWEQFDNYVKRNFPSVKVSKMKCEGGNEAICNQKGVNGFPTVILYYKNKEFKFDGNRTISSLADFIVKNIPKADL
jgi:protein disulfide-isomerase A6